MRSLAGWVILVAACGKVGEAPLPPAADAALDAFSCSAPQMACGDTCVDPTSDPKNCGGCGITCESAGESCQAGVCMDTVATCQDLWAQNPTAGSGVYTFASGEMLYCDAANQISYSGVYYGQYNAPATGFKQISLTDLKSPPLQQAFVAFFNAQGGAKLISSWMSGDCCVKFDQTNQDLLLGTGNSGQAYVEPGACNPATPAAVAPITVWVGTALTVENAPLASNFFSSFVPSGSAAPACEDSNNPSYFWKVP